MKRVLFFLIIAAGACTPLKKISVDDIINADRKFSARAGAVGYGKAFIEFAHPDAVILRKNSMPVVGREAIAAIYSQVDTTGIKFSWEPISGQISKSGELGFTYGTYTLQKNGQILRGTYASIWKKDITGEWKYILDTGNEGIGNQK